MKKYVDLHIHSTHSDGSWTPEMIVERAVKYELCAISLTDHDTASGNSEAMEFSKKLRIDFIPGIEISTKWCQGRMHILGYFIDYSSQAIVNLMKELQESRRQRVYKTCEKLTELGKPIDPAMVFEIAKNSKSVGRPHIANAMVKLGYVPTLQTAFDLYISHNRPAYVPRWAPEPQEAVKTIHSAGGLAVVAHCPVTEGCMKVIDQTPALGIDGIEVFYPPHKPHEIAKLKEFAKIHNLVITGGSDCHGLTRGEPLLGIYKVSCEVYEGLIARHNTISQNK